MFAAASGSHSHERMAECDSMMSNGRVWSVIVEVCRASKAATNGLAREDDLQPTRAKVRVGLHAKLSCRTCPLHHCICLPNTSPNTAYQRVLYHTHSITADSITHACSKRPSTRDHHFRHPQSLFPRCLTTTPRSLPQRRSQAPCLSHVRPLTPSHSYRLHPLRPARKHHQDVHL